MMDQRVAEEIQLLNEAQRGNAEAFGRLYEFYAPVIFRFLYARLNDRLDAEDLTGEVFLRAWQSLPQYKENGVPFIAYLFRVARNALIDFYRRSKDADRTRPYEEDIAGERHIPLPEPSSSAEERREIQFTLAQLREDYRTVLSLRFFAGLSPDETAIAMGRSAGAVRVLQHRALAALREKIVHNDAILSKS